MGDTIENILKMMSRIKQTGDGIDFINYLHALSSDNYEAFKKDPAQQNDIHKGYAIAIDHLIVLFGTCEEKLKLLEKTQEIVNEQVGDSVNPHY